MQQQPPLEDLNALLDPPQRHPLDVSGIASAADILKIRDQLTNVSKGLKIARAVVGQGGQVQTTKKAKAAAKANAPGPAVVGGAASLQVTQACLRFAQRRPDIATAAGTSADRFSRIVGLRLGLTKARTATGLIDEAAGDCVLRVAAVLTDRNDKIEDCVNQKRADPTTPKLIGDRLYIQFSNQNKLIQGVAAAEKLRQAGRNLRDAALIDGIDQTNQQNLNSVTIENAAGTLPSEDELTLPAPTKKVHKAPATTPAQNPAKAKTKSKAKKTPKIPGGKGGPTIH